LSTKKYLHNIQSYHYIYHQICTKKKTIGRIDKADFPELNLHNIEVKIDTGAYTSAIHCDNIEELEKDNKKQIKFKLSFADGNSTKNMELYASQYALKNIKSSKYHCVVWQNLPHQFVAN